MDIPSPRECGLPEEFDTWRPNQEDAISMMLQSPKRAVAVSAPTGFGKSAVCVAAALLSKVPTCIVTNSRGLQDQIVKVFGPCGVVDLRGRNNYPCSLRDDYSCQEGYHAACPYKGSIACPSTQAEMRAAVSYIVVTNYDKWTSSKGHGLGMSHFQQVIFDEGHDAPDALARAMQIIITEHDIEKELKIEYPLTTESFNCWKIWALYAKTVCEDKLTDLTALCDETNPKPSWIRRFFHMRDLLKKLSTLCTARDDEWVVDEKEDHYQFDPIRPARYSESTLLLRMPRIIVMSATLRPKTMYMLGIGKQSFEFVEYPSDFNPARCPIYWVPTMRVDARSAKDLSMLWVRLDQVLSRRRDRKGIIHTISYARRDEILNRSRFSSSMMINQKGEPPTSMVEAFKQSGPGTVLVSPSVGTGYDFPMDTCEFQFMCKIPFPDSRSKIVKARQEDDKEYGPYHALQKLVQAFGRGMRSKQDSCENFIGDDHLAWFLPRYGYLAPKSFHNFFRKVDVLPQPPKSLSEVSRGI